MKNKKQGLTAAQLLDPQLLAEIEQESLIKAGKKHRAFSASATEQQKEEEETKPTDL